MSKFVKYKLKDGRQIRGRYDHDTDKVFISREDFEGLLNESDVAYEQAKQLQTIIENLQEIKAGAVRKAIGDIKAKIEQEYNLLGAARADETLELGECLGLKMSLKIINKYQAESEE